MCTGGEEGPRRFVDCAENEFSAGWGVVFEDCIVRRSKKWAQLTRAVFRNARHVLDSLNSIPGVTASSFLWSRRKSVG